MFVSSLSLSSSSSGKSSYSLSSLNSAKFKKKTLANQLLILETQIYFSLFFQILEPVYVYTTHRFFEIALFLYFANELSFIIWMTEKESPEKMNIGEVTFPQLEWNSQFRVK